VHLRPLSLPLDGLADYSNASSVNPEREGGERKCSRRIVRPPPKRWLLRKILRMQKVRCICMG